MEEQTVPEISLAFYIKTFSVLIIMFLLSLFLADKSVTETTANTLLSSNIYQYLIFGGWFLAIALISSLTIGFWKSNLLAHVTALPTSLAIFLVFINLGILYALAAFGVTFLLITYGIYQTTQIKQNFVKFIPEVALQPTIKIILMTFCLAAGVAGIIQAPAINPGKTAADTIGSNVQSLVDGSIKQNQAASAIQQFTGVTLDTKQIIETQVNTLIEPVKQYMRFFYGLFVFLTLQFIASLVYYVYAVVCGMFFWIFEGLGFLKKRKEMVEREVVGF